MAENHSCGCGSTCGPEADRRDGPAEEKETYRCECGATSKSPRTHCGKPMEKVS